MEWAIHPNFDPWLCDSHDLVASPLVGYGRFSEGYARSLVIDRLHGWRLEAGIISIRENIWKFLSWSIPTSFVLSITPKLIRNSKYFEFVPNTPYKLKASPKTFSLYSDTQSSKVVGWVHMRTTSFVKSDGWSQSILLLLQTLKFTIFINLIPSFSPLFFNNNLQNYWFIQTDKTYQSLLFNPFNYWERGAFNSFQT